MSRWFRFYDRALDDPKVQRLAPDVFKGWVNVLCLASRNDGKLPSVPDIAFALRITDREADSLITALMGAGLLEDSGEKMVPHKWNELQFQGDKDPTNAERQRRFREKNRNDSVTRYAPVTSHPPEQIQIQNRTDEMRAKTRDLIPSKLVFPSDGSIEYTPFAAIARKHGGGADVDLLANRFRGWCMTKNIDLADPHIDKTFATFCSKNRIAA